MFVGVVVPHLRVPNTQVEQFSPNVSRNPDIINVGILVAGCSLDFEKCSEGFLRQQSYAIKYQLGHPKALLGNAQRHSKGHFVPELVLYGIRLLA